MSVTPPELPDEESLAGQYYAWHRQGELRLQRCGDCRAWAHPPRYTCPHCGSRARLWERTAGRGEVYSWSVTHQALHPAFAELVPYCSVIVALVEGPRVLTTVTGLAIEALRVGLPVEVVFPADTFGHRLAVFRPAVG